MKTRIVLLAAGTLGVALAGWLAANPGGRFGLSRDMLTTYNRLPVPLADVQVRSDGAMRLTRKTHRVAEDQLAWLASPQPTVLIVAAGWQQDVRIVGEVTQFPQARVVRLPTGEALALFNSLRDQGVQVAIHVHSTC